MLALATVVAIAVPVVRAAAQPPDDGPTSIRQQLEELGKQFAPEQRPSPAVMRGDAKQEHPNPWLSLLRSTAGAINTFDPMSTLRGQHAAGWQADHVAWPGLA